MGQAKQRKRAGTYPTPNGASVPFFNVATGQHDTARAAGDPIVFYRQFRAALQSHQPVPCNGCTNCCYHAGVDVDPHTEPPEHLAHLDLEWREQENGWFLRKRQDGACIHLGLRGCSVYEHRPSACRQYDCRLYALTSVLDRYDGDKTQPMWMFQPKSLEGRVFLAAVAMMGQVRFLKARHEGSNCSAAEIARQVFADPALPKVLNAVQTLAVADPETQKRMLGVDPRSLSLQQLTDNWNKLLDAMPPKTLPLVDNS